MNDFVLELCKYRNWGICSARNVVSKYRHYIARCLGMGQAIDIIARRMAKVLSPKDFHYFVRLAKSVRADIIDNRQMLYVSGRIGSKRR